MPSVYFKRIGHVQEKQQLSIDKISKLGPGNRLHPRDCPEAAINRVLA